MTRLRGLATVVFCLFVLMCVSSAGMAGPAESTSVGRNLQQQANPLVLLAKDECRLKVKCDGYAPANTCRNPPCCKKWHLEKVCQPKDSGQSSESKKTPDGGATPDPPKPQPTEMKTLICPVGMIGEKPNCQCPPGAKLQPTGKYTKGCICFDGRKPFVGECEGWNDVRQ